jgi:O-antigen/teichoic acid export membrane protein
VYNPAMRRLFHVGSVSGALGVYVSASVAGKAIGFARTLVFVHLLAAAPAEYNVWTIGLMVLTLAGTALCLGANQALTRYVSVHQARGELAVFLRRVAGPLAAVPMLLAVPALLAAEAIASWLAPAGRAVTAADVQVVRLAVLNGVLLAMYLQMVGVLYGLRTYRLASAVELFFTVLFTVGAVVWLATTRRGVDLLWCHLACLAVSVVAGVWLTTRAIRSTGGTPVLRRRSGGYSASDCLPSQVNSPGWPLRLWGM